MYINTGLIRSFRITNEEKDLDLFKHLLGMLQRLTIDYTVFFKTLSHYDGDRTALLKLGLYHKPMMRD